MSDLVQLIHPCIRCCGVSTNYGDLLHRTLINNWKQLIDLSVVAMINDKLIIIAIDVLRYIKENSLPTVEEDRTAGHLVKALDVAYPMWTKYDRIEVHYIFPKHPTHTT